MNLLHNFGKRLIARAQRRPNIYHAELILKLVEEAYFELLNNAFMKFCIFILIKIKLHIRRKERRNSTKTYYIELIHDVKLVHETIPGGLFSANLLDNAFYEHFVLFG